MKLCRGRLLSDDKLKQLSEHQYSSQGITTLEKLFLLSYWDWLTLKIPIWLAPNFITILGFTINVATTLILVWYSPDAKQEAPKWACGLGAVGVFVYQSLDGIDGKQARRTGTASPLGELFDHGCDGISIVFLAVALCIGLQVGYYPRLMIGSCFMAMTLFYCAHWQKYISGTLRFGSIDAIEAECGVIGVLFVSALFGPSVWSMEIFGLELGMKWIVLIIAGINGIFLVLTNVSIIFTAAMKNERTVAGTRVLSPVLPLLLGIISIIIICCKSTEHIYRQHPVLYTFAFGLLMSKITNSLIVAQMTKSKMTYIDSSHLGAAMFLLNQCFGPFVKEYYFLWFCLFWVVTDLLTYCYQICVEISDYLDVEVFKIPYSVA